MITRLEGKRLLLRAWRESDLGPHGARPENQIELRGYRMDVHRHPPRDQSKLN